MKLVSYLKNNQEFLGLFHNGNIYNLKESGSWLNLELPSTMKEFLEEGETIFNQSLKVYEAIENDKINSYESRENIKLLSPVTNPPSCRDGYAFRQHVEAARRNRNVEMIPEFDQYPVFYFTNHNAVFGEGDLYLEEDHFQQLDFELEVAIVIGKGGKNIKAEDADNHILGLMIMNDLSARKLQMDEMKLNLGPAKGKDFATTFGPYLVTHDELDDYKVDTEFGAKYDLRMTARHNGKTISEGNVKDMNWTFAEIIERASYGVELKPGDVIGSGTVGTGCYLELNGTNARLAKEAGEEFTPVWLQEGDIIELEIEGLGILKNTLYKSKNTYSLLAKNKNVASRV